MTGSGNAGDPIVPEYVVQGTTVAQAGIAANTATTTAGATMAGAATTSTSQGGGPVPVTPKPVAPLAGTMVAPVAAPPGPMSSRPGILAWSMQLTDDGTMAIIHVVAADRNAFQAILADTRPEIRVFEIGKDTPAAINAALRQYKQNFDLDSFKVVVQ